MRLGFATDVHLDSIEGDKANSRRQLAAEKMASDVDALVIGGDISLGPHLTEHLSAFCRGAGVPVYFVLGNHDFWDLRHAKVQAAAAEFPGYLDRAGVVELTATTALVGRSGWYDALSGNPFAPSNVSPKDWRRTERLVSVWRDAYQLQRACRAWATEETEAVRPVLEAAADRYEHIFFVTHFPCFTEACWDEDGYPDIEERGWWPWSINTTMGHMLLEVVESHPKVDFTLLTGHTHGGGRKQLRDNLLCFSGKARYGHPALAHEFTLG
jgi:3',5'-cyclic AMP phosphodiesterase CpdA